MGSSLKWVASLGTALLLVSCGFGSTRPLQAKRPPAKGFVTVSASLPTATAASVTGTYPLAVSFQPDGTGVVSLAECAGKVCTGEAWTTTDLGATWAKAPTGTPPLTQVEAMPGGGFAGVASLAGGGGADVFVEATVGAPWTKVFTSTWDQVSAQFDSLQDGYVSVRGGCATQQCGLVISHTTDGGRTWTEVAQNDVIPGSPTSGGTIPLWEPGLIYASASGTLAAYSPTPQGTVAVSADGGRSWKVTLSQSGTAPTAAVSASGIGWAMEGPSDCASACAYSIEKTKNGGATWAPAGKTPSVSGAQPLVAPDGSLWIAFEAVPGCTSCVELSPATAAGSGQVVVEPNALPPGVDPGHVEPLGSQSAVALAAGAPEAALYVTRDGGRKWTQAVRFNAPLVPTEGFGMWSARAGWGLVSSNGIMSLAATTDGGSTWQPFGNIPPSAQANMITAGFASRMVGWLAGLSQVWVTTDGGQSWVTRTLPGPFIGPVSFSSASRGAVVVHEGNDKTGPWLLEVTSDGGRQWRSAPGNTVRAGAVARDGELVACFATATGLAVRTSSDGGRRWVTVGTIPQFLTPMNVGIAVDGTVWASNYDTLWLFPKGSPAEEIVFGKGTFIQGPPSVLTHERIALMSAGAIYRSDNGGKSWSAVAAQPQLPF